MGVDRVSAGGEPVYGFEASREDAMQAFTRCWLQSNSARWNSRCGGANWNFVLGHRSTSPPEMCHALFTLVESVLSLLKTIIGAGEELLALEWRGHLGIVVPISPP